MSNTSNISSVISPDVLKTVSTSAIIKTFGDQLKNKAKEKVVVVLKNKAGELEIELEQLIKDEQQAGIDHNNELKRLETIYQQGQITKEKYDKAVVKENEAYDKQKESFKLRKTKIEKDIKNIITDPFDKIKEDRKKRKAQRQEKRAKNKQRDAQSKRDANKKVIKNAAKTLAPIIALQIANQLSAIISQRAKLEELVDQVNTYIDTANTPETTAIATNLRNNTITLINNSISKLQNLQNTLNQINTYLAIFNAIVTVLSAIPIPTSVPPGIGIPINVITKIIKALEKANKLISALNVVLAIATISLENEVNKLNELILRLKNVNLDGLNSQQLSDLTSSIYNNVDQFPPYKGFKFKIKEEQNQAFVVKGNKRHYAVATNRDGVEILKSEYSFTLDPNDLIDQLKLIIDQRNLQG
jgi:DNA repair exonuclease SbcCD ATPase subunit